HMIRATSAVESINHILSPVYGKSWNNEIATLRHAGFEYDTFQMGKHIRNLTVQTIPVSRFAKDVICLCKGFGCAKNTIIRSTNITGISQSNVGAFIFNTQVNGSTTQ